MDLFPKSPSHTEGSENGSDKVLEYNEALLVFNPIIHTCMLGIINSKVLGVEINKTDINIAKTKLSSRGEIWRAFRMPGRLIREDTTNCHLERRRDFSRCCIKIDSTFATSHPRDPQQKVRVRILKTAL